MSAASLPVVDVGGGDLYSGGRSHFEGGGCSCCSAVREQPPDHVDEIASPIHTDDGDEQSDVLRGSERVGVDDVEHVSFRCIANKECERVGGRMAVHAFVAGNHRRRALKYQELNLVRPQWMQSDPRDPSKGVMSPPAHPEVMSCGSCPDSINCWRWRCPSCQSLAPSNRCQGQGLSPAMRSGGGGSHRG